MHFTGSIAFFWVIGYNERVKGGTAMVAHFAHLNSIEQAQLDLWLDWDANRKEGKKVLPFPEHLHRMDAWLSKQDHEQDWVEELHEAVKNALANWVE